MTNIRSFCYLAQCKAGNLSLARDLHRDGVINVAAVYDLNEMKLLVTEVDVKYILLIREVNDRLIFYRYPVCGPGL